MRPFWHPVSALIVPDPPMYASPAVLRLLLAGSGVTEVGYAGDRMWPAIVHGERVRLERAGSGVPRAGDVVVSAAEGHPDLYRIAGVRDRVLRLVADADPGEELEADVGGVIAAAPALQGPVPPLLTRRTRRLALDLRESVAGEPDASPDPAETVREKYGAQAVFYRRSAGPEMEPSFLGRVRRNVVAGGRVLVAGSGTGRECFALAAEGWMVTGVDFAKDMIAAARDEASRRGLAVNFVAADLREHDEPGGSLDAVVFTYDVYSFIPRAADRVAVLRRIRLWLRPHGVLFLSARRVRGPYERLILSLQRWRAGHSGLTWGASHTRWIAGQGELRRSFVHVFGERTLRREEAAAGFVRARWEGGHGMLRPAAA